MTKMGREMYAIYLMYVYGCDKEKKDNYQVSPLIYLQGKELYINFCQGII